MVSKSLEILQVIQHREEPSFSNQFINHNIQYTFIILGVYTLRGHLCNKFKNNIYIEDDLIKIGDCFNITFNLTLKIGIQI